MKNRPTDADVDTFLATVPDDARRADCRALLRSMARITGAPARLWGTGIVGFGRYRYASGREGEWFLTGFAPRKRDLTVYVMPGFAGCGGAARASRPASHREILPLSQIAGGDRLRGARDAGRHMRRRYPDGGDGDGGR